LKVGDLIRRGVEQEEVYTMLEAGEFPELMREEIQPELLDVVEDSGFTAIVHDVTVGEALQRPDRSVGAKAFVLMMKEAKVNIEELITETLPKEFGPEDTQPVQEIAKISVMMKEGLQAQEIVSMMETNQLPSLKKPESQAPLLKIVEEYGQRALVCQVLIEETVKDMMEGLPTADVPESREVPCLDSAVQSQVTLKNSSPPELNETWISTAANVACWNLTCHFNVPKLFIKRFFSQIKLSGSQQFRVLAF